MPRGLTEPGLRFDPAFREIIRGWRALTGASNGRDDERSTVVACSAGADSSALAIALARVARARVVLAHVVHDMRSREVALRDRDAARELAAGLGLPFVQAEIATRGVRGNAESNARVLRYRALARLALEYTCRFVAAAHHADDQIETVLMRLCRGTGVRGLSGIAPSRGLPGGVTLVRPMLTLTRADAERICTAAGWEWREDQTNQDTSRLRAALRARVTPVLAELSPTLAARGAATSRVLRDAADFVSMHAKIIVDQGRQGDGFRWSRGALRSAHRAPLGEAIRAAVVELNGGRGRDRLSSGAVLRVVGAITSDTGHPRSFTLAGATIEVTARSVGVTPAATGNQHRQRSIPSR